MTKYLWNVRTFRISYDYIEEIVEAETKAEAEAMVDSTSYAYDDEAWVIDEDPSLFVNEHYTQRMDIMFPESYDNPDKENTDDV